MEIRTCLKPGFSYRTMIAAVMLLAPITGQARDPDRPFRSYGYGFAGFSSWSVGTLLFPAGSHGTDYRLGFGGEARIAGNLAVGAEIGIARCTKCYGSASEYRHNLFSASASYHFPLSKTSRFVPFVTAGYSGWWSPRVNLIHVGGGLNYWFHRHLGLKFDYRENSAGKRDSAAPVTGVLTIKPRLSDLRFGIAFR